MEAQNSIFTEESKAEWQHNVQDEAVAKFQVHYNDKKITHDDIFDYVAAILDCPTYLEKYKESLTTATNIPYAPDFWAYVKAGKKMSYLHLNYEILPQYPLKETWVQGGNKNNPDHWKFGKPYNTISGKKEMWYMDAKNDTPATLAVNDFLWLDAIPPEAYRYEISGRTCIWWLKNRYVVKTDPESGIVNDANDLFKKPQDFIALIKSVVTFAVAMNRIRQAMPKEVTGEPKQSNPITEEEALAELDSLLEEIVS